MPARVRDLDGMLGAMIHSQGLGGIRHLALLLALRMR
jgi:hypothetical protein